jgi:nicotinate-nucleotide--dimethylbenzimidazole phosphoribosyltransferase
MLEDSSDPALVLPAIADVYDAARAAHLQHLLDNKTKPRGSLGRIEALALQLGLILQSDAPALAQPQLVICAADHGLAARGVSAYPPDVTWQMVENFLAGGAAVSVLARQHGLDLTIVDCGVRHDFVPPGAPDGQRPGLVVRKPASGTADASIGPAMSRRQCAEAVANGIALVKTLPGNVVLLGEMGIGNTSAAALLVARLTGADITDCAGAGTGVTGAAFAHKVGVLRAVLHHHADVAMPFDVLAAMGGLEIATLVGVALQAASERRVIVVDGFITTAAVLVASALVPAVTGYCVFSHRSDERGHGRVLQRFGAQPLLDLGLRLGEGSGAALAWPLVLSAAAVLREMASFESAGVSQAM